jgi:hypothetical protein
MDTLMAHHQFAPAREASVNAHASRLHSILTKTIVLTFTVSTLFAPAQNPQIQQRVQEIKQSTAANKQALAKYTWEEQQTISLKGEVKKVQTFLVRIGPDGKQQKQEMNAQPAAQPSGGRLKRHIVEKKKEEFQEYGEQIAALAKQYAQFDPDTFQDAYQKGNVSFQPDPGDGTVNLIIKSFLKPGDSVTLGFNPKQKGLQSFVVDSYLNDPKDAVKINVQFAKIPNGPNHVASMLVNGVSKQLTVNIQNSNYQLAS